MPQNSAIDKTIERTVRSLASYLRQAGEQPQDALYWVIRVKEEMDHLEEIAVLRAINSGCSKSKCAKLLKITRQTLDNRYKAEIENLKARKAAAPSNKLYIEDSVFHGHVKPVITETPVYIRMEPERALPVVIHKEKGDEHRPLLIEWAKFCEEEESTGHKPTKAAFARKRRMSRPTLVRKLRIAEMETSRDTPDTPDTQRFHKLNFDQRDSQQS